MTGEAEADHQRGGEQPAHRERADPEALAGEGGRSSMPKPANEQIRAVPSDRSRPSSVPAAQKPSAMATRKSTCPSSWAVEMARVLVPAWWALEMVSLMREA
jgi:hypothetical protein